jgi:hypothetical protein
MGKMKHRKIKYLFFIALLLIPACQFSREDFFSIATSQPDIEVTPLTDGGFDFGTVDVYGVKSQEFFIENTGTRTLELTKLYPTDPSIREFIIDTEHTVSELSPGESTFFTIHYKPIRDTSSALGMVVESNDPDEELFLFSLSGTGVYASGNPPEIVVEDSGVIVPNGGTYDFTEVYVGQAISTVFTVSNSVNAYYMLSVTDVSFVDGDIFQFMRVAPDIPANLIPGESTTFTIEFSPESDSFYQAQIEILNDDPDDNPFTFSIGGWGKIEPDLQVLHGSIPLENGYGILTFGSLYMGESHTQFITLRNGGNMPLTVSGMNIDDSNDPQNFSSSTTLPLSIAAGDSVTVPFTFTPQTTGTLTANVVITSTDPYERDYAFSLEGFGASAPAPDIRVSDTETGADVPSGSLGHDFTTVSVGTTLDVSFTVENTGTDVLQILDAYVSGDTDQFSLIGVPVPPENSIDPGGSVVLNVSYTPKSSGSHSATLYLDSNDPDGEENPYKVEIKGKGSEKDAADIQILVGGKKYESGSSYYFNSLFDPLTYGGSITRTFTLKNTGKAVLVVSDAMIVSGDGDDFFFNLPVPVTLTAGKTFEFTVTFKPTVNPFLFAQKRQTRIQIQSNDPDETPFKIDLIGYVR